MTRTIRKVNPNWEDKDYGYAKANTWDDGWEGITYTYTRRGMLSREDARWRAEYLTQQFLEYARIKQVCLAGAGYLGCDEERGSEACRQCLELSADDWSPLNFD